MHRGRTMIDPALFSRDAVDPETASHNEALIAAARKAPPRWSFSPDELREQRRTGLGPFPLQTPSPRAENLSITTDDGVLALRLIASKANDAKGVFLHIHGGGWMLGSAAAQDQRLEELSNRTGLACLSVEYRLAPEHPYPAANDDCEAAALWLVRNAWERFGTDRLFIGGESAGAHLSVTTLLRLRDRHDLTPFAGAVLTCGAFDLAMTPSMRAFRKPLVLSREDVEQFRKAYLQNDEALDDPDVSPLHADLTGMPPALFSCGTEDGLIDDTLFMAARWAAAGHRAEIALSPGGPHAFQGMDLALARKSNERIDAFLARLIERPGRHASAPS